MVLFEAELITLLAGVALVKLLYVLAPSRGKKIPKAAGATPEVSPEVFEEAREEQDEDPVSLKAASFALLRPLLEGIPKTAATHIMKECTTISETFGRVAWWSFIEEGVHGAFASDLKMQIAHDRIYGVPMIKGLLDLQRLDRVAAGIRDRAAERKEKYNEMLERNGVPEVSEKCKALFEVLDEVDGKCVVVVKDRMWIAALASAINWSGVTARAVQSRSCRLSSEDLDTVKQFSSGAVRVLVVGKDWWTPSKSTSWVLGDGCTAVCFDSSERRSISPRPSVTKGSWTSPRSGEGSEGSSCEGARERARSEGDFSEGDSKGRSVHFAIPEIVIQTASSEEGSSEGACSEPEGGSAPPRERSSSCRSAADLAAAASEQIPKTWIPRTSTKCWGPQCGRLSVLKYPGLSAEPKQPILEMPQRPILDWPVPTTEP